MDLGQIVGDFALAMEVVDHRSPQATSQRDATKLYQPGIGPFSEDAAVALTLAEMQAVNGAPYLNAGKRRYPLARHVCDLVLGELPDWALEVKLARLGRDNGTYEDAAIKKILSPYPDDRSAVTDCVKLARSGFAGKQAILIYGFDDPDRPLRWLIEAFEVVAARHAVLGPRTEARLGHLVHPVFSSGGVYAWQVLGVTHVPAACPSARAVRVNHGNSRKIDLVVPGHGIRRSGTTRDTDFPS